MGSIEVKYHELRGFLYLLERYQIKYCFVDYVTRKKLEHLKKKTRCLLYTEDMKIEDMYLTYAVYEDCETVEWLLELFRMTCKNELPCDENAVEWTLWFIDWYYE